MINMSSTKTPYTEMITLFNKLRIFNSYEVVNKIVSVQNKNEYVKIFKNYNNEQNGGGITKIQYKDEIFEFHSYHIEYMVYYNLLSLDDGDQDSCISIEINKKNNTAHIQSIHMNEKCFKQTLNKSGSILFKVCLKLINKIKEKYKLKYVWLTDIAEKYCDKNKTSLRLCDFAMSCNGNTWYGQYNFLPFDQQTESLNIDRYELYLYNKHILTKTKVKCTNLKQYIINSMMKDVKLSKQEIKELEKKLNKYDDLYVSDLMSDFFNDFNKNCHMFNNIYWLLRDELKLHDLFEFKYFLKL